MYQYIMTWLQIILFSYFLLVNKQDSTIGQKQKILVYIIM